MASRRRRKGKSSLALLEIKDLQVHFVTEAGLVQAVDGVSLAVEAGHTLGVVGESGCGKSVSALSVLRLVPQPPGRIAGGEILWKGRDLLKLPARGRAAFASRPNTAGSRRGCDCP